MRWRVALIGMMLAWTGSGAHAEAEAPFTIVVPEIYCPYDGTIEGYDENAELKSLILGHQTMLAAYEPCPDSGLPEGSAFAIGILGAGDAAHRALAISREQYLARLDRRTGPSVWEELVDEIGDLGEDESEGTIPLGVVARDAAGIHFGFVHTGYSRDERDWQITFLGNTLIDEMPVLITTVARYGNLEIYNATLDRHVAVNAGLVAANAPLVDLETINIGFWIQVGAIVVVVLLAALVSWNLLRRREATAFDPEDEAVRPDDDEEAGYRADR